MVQQTPDAGGFKPEVVLPSMVDVGVDKFVIVRIDDDGHRVEQVDQAPMLPTMAEYTAHDFFDALEFAATP